MTEGGPARIHYVIEIGISGARLFRGIVVLYVLFYMFCVLSIQYLEGHCSRGSSLLAMVLCGMRYWENW